MEITGKIRQNETKFPIYGNNCIEKSENIYKFCNKNASQELTFCIPTAIIEEENGKTVSLETGEHG
jgi:hypothetical protein